MPYSNNTYSGFLEESPETMYMGFAGGKKTTNPFLDWYRSNYGSTHDAYLSQLGNQALTGQAPILSFLDYLNQNNPMKGWGLLSPSQRGERTATRSLWNL